MAHKTGAIGPKDLERVVVDTTVQPKAIAHPTDARLMHRAITKPVGLAKRNRVPLRQSYLRLAKRAAIMVGRYTHAHQFKRARRQLKFLRTRLGRIIRDIRRKIDGDAVLEARFGPLLGLAQQVRSQDQHQRGPKVYALHAPEVECIGKGKAHAPYEVGCKVSNATPVTSPKGGQFVLHAKALHGNPFDGHTLGPVITDMEKLTGVEARRIHVDKGYRGHNYPHRFRVWISGQVRRVTASIRREMKRRAAVEPVIGHVKAEHRMDRNYLRDVSATASTLFSPQPATTSACSCDGSQSSCVSLSEPSSRPSLLKTSLEPGRRVSSSQTTLYSTPQISLFVRQTSRPRQRFKCGR